MLKIGFTFYTNNREAMDSFGDGLALDSAMDSFGCINEYSVCKKTEYSLIHPNTLGVFLHL